MDRSKEVRELEKKLAYHDHLYHDLDDPEIDEDEYTALKLKYKELTGEDYDDIKDEITAVVKSGFKKINHVYPVTSLKKVNTEEELRAALQKLLPVVVQDKLDGLTEVTYDYKTKVSRGNGKEGELLTSTVDMVENLGSKDITLGYGPVRKEIFMYNSEFNRINEEREAAGKKLLKTPRNGAAGMLRQHDPKKVEGLTYRAYNIMGSTLSESEQLKLLNECGFLTVNSKRFEKDQLEEAVDYIINFDRSQYNYDIDGLVIKNDEPNSLERFGQTGHHPNNAVAYKFPAQGEWTMLEKVDWQVGRTGKITPVAILRPITIGGVLVKRATLNNIAFINDLNIRINETVFVVRSNEVIPKIIEGRFSPLRNTFPIVSPTECPTCGSEVEKVKDQIFCRNPECHAKDVLRLVHLASRDALNIEGLGEETAEKIFEANLISDPFQVFDLTVDDILKLDGFAEKSANNLFEAIQKSRDTGLHKFLYAAGLPLIGRTASEDIANKFGSWDAMLALGESGHLEDELKSIDGVGKKMIEAINSYGYLWGELSNYITPHSTVVKKTTVAPGKVLTIVVTGSFVDESGNKISREVIETMIKDAGHKPSGSVSKKTDYVLVGEDAGSKADKAKDLQVKILTTIDQLKKVI
jgi:DNA ligase (NAD+)